MGSPLTGLNIFKSDIVKFFSICKGMADVLQHLHTTGFYIKFIGFHADCLHQLHGIGIRFICCGKSRHGIGLHMRARQI